MTLQPLSNGSDPNTIKVAASIRIPGYQSIIVTEDEPTSRDSSRQVGIGKLSSGDTVPSVLIQSCTGGAHCCALLRAVVPVAGKLKVLNFEGQDGDGIKAFPRDLDGDGVLDFQYQDDRFRYAFASGAGSWSPPVIFNIYKGNLVDVSSQPSFASVFKRYAAEAKRGCEKQDDTDRNGACAAYVAAETRLGNYEQALVNAEKLADRNATLPSDCTVPYENYLCPAGKEVTFDSFVSALTWFLHKNGYTN